MKPPPHDLPLERQVISCAISNPDMVPLLLGILQPTDFYSPMHATIWRVVTELYSEQKPIDPVLLAASLRAKGQPNAVTELTAIYGEEPYDAHAEAHANQLAEYSRNRQLIRILQEAITEAYDNPKPDDFTSAICMKIQKVGYGAGQNEIVSMRQVLTESAQSLQERAESPSGLAGYPTGFLHLDEILGGLCEGDLTIVAGRPGMGKSAFANQIATQCCYLDPRVTVAGSIFSLEMPRKQIGNRSISSWSQVELSTIRRGNLNMAQWERIADSVRAYVSLPVWVADTPGITLAKLESMLSKILVEIAQLPPVDEKPVKLGVVVVDYIQLMRGETSRGGTRDQEIGSLSRGMKTLAKKYGVAMIVLSQLSRKVEERADKRPAMGDLRESGNLEQDADNIVLLYRDDYYNPQSKEPGVAEIAIEKQRNGATGIVKLGWHGPTTTFYSIDQQTLQPDP